jgi:hypothetical protein
MARSERQADGTRGGVGTIARSGTRPRPQQPADPGQAVSDPGRGRTARPVPPPRPGADQRAAQAQRTDAGPRTADRPDRRAPAKPAAKPAARRPSPGRTTGPQPVRTTGPQPVRTTGPQPALRPAPLRQAAAATASGHRMPFVLLLCGLLGGALVSALVISTTLAEGSFQITNLQDSTSALARQNQTLQEEVAQAQSAQVIEQRASQLGMRRPGELRFIDLKSGKTTNDGPTWIGALDAPGYAP